jgi:hypothetical protein
MFLSQTVAQAIHADRVRDLERVSRERRLMTANDENVSRGSEPAHRVRIATTANRPACDGSAGQPA